MIKKFIQGLIVTIFIILLPASGNKSVLMFPHLWILIIIGVLASLFQPQYNPFEPAPDNKDKGTANQIIWSIFITQLAVVIEGVYFRYPESVSWTMTTTLALTAMVTGLIIRTWSVITLGKYFTWHVATQKDQTIIRTGPYAFVRHPGYFGAFLTYASTGIFLRAWIAFLFSIPILLAAFLRRIHYEEKELKSSLGINYENYSLSVKRFIPWIY